MIPAAPRIARRDDIRRAVYRAGPVMTRRATSATKASSLAQVAAEISLMAMTTSTLLAMKADLRRLEAEARRKGDLTALAALNAGIAAIERELARRSAGRLR
jgi:hypothetical protein